MPLPLPLANPATITTTTNATTLATASYTVTTLTITLATSLSNALSTTTANALATATATTTAIATATATTAAIATATATTAATDLATITATANTNASCHGGGGLRGDKPPAPALPPSNMKDGGGGTKLGLRLEGGSESLSMIVLQVLLPRMEHQTKRKGEEFLGDVGSGVWSLIQQTIGQLHWRVFDEAKKGGAWSVVCKYLCASQRAQSPACQHFFFFENPQTPGRWTQFLGIGSMSLIWWMVDLSKIQF
jgi:hypothetical protein